MTKDPEELLRAAGILGAEAEAFYAQWEEVACREIGDVQGPGNLILRDTLLAILADAANTLTDSESSMGVDSEEESLRFCSDACLDAIGFRAVRQVLGEFAALRHVLSAELPMRGVQLPVVEAINRLVEVRALETAVLLMGQLHERQTEGFGSSAHDIRNQLFVAAGNLFLLKSAGPENYPMLLERLEDNVATTLRMLESFLAPPDSL